MLREGAALFAEHADIHAELGLTLSLMGRPEAAEPCYRRALELRPNDLFPLGNLAGTLQQLKRLAEAETLYRRVLEIDPGHPQALRNLGLLMKDAARFNEAKEAYRLATRRDPGLEAAIQARLALTPMIRSTDDIEVQRADYARGLLAFDEDPRSYAYGGEPANLPWFHLAYHDRDDRELLERTAAVLRQRLPDLNAAAPHLPAWRPPADTGRRLRVAFCSEFFYAHTIGRLYRGLIAGMDRSRFEVIVLHGSNSVRDRFREDVDRFAHRAEVLARSPEEQRRQIAALAPDVLFFPDIGMSAQTYFLAHGRLAPVQATSWGHPNTSGLDSLDYFVSCDAIEPEGAETSYTEGLVRMGRLPGCYPRPAAALNLPRAALRLPEDGVLYGCPQSLFKLHPDFDPVLARIAEADPAGHIVLLAASSPGWTTALKERWAGTHPVLLDRVHFLPRLSHEGFMAHLAHIDVLLDPLHFGSGNTLYEAMAFGTPIVTWPGRFSRGRIVAAAYRQMGVADPPIAPTPEAYARVAIELGRDAGRRSALRAELQAKAREALYEDRLAVREFEAFLVAAVEAAARSERLPTGWRPALQVGAA